MICRRTSSLSKRTPTWLTPYSDLYLQLARRCELRFHISIESDRDRLPGLPPPASSVEKRFEAAAALRAAGLRVLITVSPLLPISEPRGFFERIAQVADGVVIDHFIRGDGKLRESACLGVVFLRSEDGGRPSGDAPRR